MKAYSLDLRERVAAACQTGLTQSAAATQFSVSLSFVAKLMRRQRTSGQVAALPPGRGPAPRLDATALVQLTACLRQTPDATLDELRGELLAAGAPAVSRSAVGRAVQRLDWRRKK
ncbi:transposase, partial [Hymenobacter sp. UV11]